MVRQRQQRRVLCIGKTACICVLAAIYLTACSNKENWEKFESETEKPMVYTTGSGKSLQLPSTEPIRSLNSEKINENELRFAELGKTLFHDRRLSGDGTVSCASCHDLASGGDDGRRTSIGVNGAIGALNAPSVLNSGLNYRLFWDGRAKNLETQARSPVVNAKEMAGDWVEILALLSEDDAFMNEFEAAFGHRDLQPQHIVRAIAAFERTLVTPSPFDDYLDGQLDAISDEAIAGYAMFKEYGCSACHQGINVGGNTMQYFGAFHSIGEYIDVDVSELDEIGTNTASLERPPIPQYKVPSLRNIELTAPYFHTGAVKNLEDAVRVMGAVQLARRLNDREIDLLVAFLKSLTGKQVQAVSTLTAASDK